MPYLKQKKILTSFPVNPHAFYASICYWAIGTHNYTTLCWLIVGVLATDRDLSGRIKYAITGDGMAPAFFRIDELTGRIYLRDGVSLRDDRNINYTVRIYQHDLGLLLCIAAARVFTYLLACLRMWFSQFSMTRYSSLSLDKMEKFFWASYFPH